MTIECDASNVALEVMFKDRVGSRKGGRNLTGEESKESSGKRKLKAIWFGMKAFERELKGETVRILSDSQAAV